MAEEPALVRQNLRPALEHLRNHEYEKALEYINKDHYMELYAEVQRIHELVGENQVSGKLGQVISNYTDRLIDDIAKKLDEGD